MMLRLLTVLLALVCGTATGSLPQPCKVRVTRLDLTGSLQGAGGIGGLLARTDANGSAFYHADGSGNVTALTDTNGFMVARYLYSPFGRMTGKWGPLADVNRYQFSSKETDRLSGLSYYGFRFYDPALQRWTSRDPIGERGGLNLYGFVGNSPVGWVDPDGLYVIGEDGFPILGTGTALDSYFWDQETNDRVDELQDQAWGDALEAGKALGSVCPIGGEIADLATALDPEAEMWDRFLAATSLGINLATAGVLPNYTPLRNAAESGASSALQGARLGEHLRQLETYGQASFKELENGSIRYYGNLKPATTPGEMSGLRRVREWNPETGGKRTWFEMLDQSGTVRSVRPETGGPKVHYIFDANGNYIGTR